MVKRDKIIFCFPASLKKKEQDWIKQQPELQLLADLVFLPIEWEDEITGTEKEWKKVLLALSKQVDHCTGIVIWAPEQSLLGLSGYLHISFEELSIPIILFSAPSPARVSSKKFLQLGLKSVLINASYLAISDIAEVLILAGSEIYRPDQCFWELKNGNKQVNSKEGAVASLHFNLERHKIYNQRTKKKNKIKQIHELTNEINYLQWYPGLDLSFDILQKNKITMIQTVDAYWEGKLLQELRNELLKNKKTIIWYSQNIWEQKEVKLGEYFLSHPHEWWAILLTQMAFSAATNSAEAFRFIDAKKL